MANHTPHPAPHSPPHQSQTKAGAHHVPKLLVVRLEFQLSEALFYLNMFRYSSFCIHFNPPLTFQTQQPPIPLFVNIYSVEYPYICCSCVQVFTTWCAITHQVRTTIFQWSKHYVLQLICIFPPSALPWPFIYPIDRLFFVLLFIYVWIYMFEISL